MLAKIKSGFWNAVLITVMGSLAMLSGIWCLLVLSTALEMYHTAKGPSFIKTHYLTVESNEPNIFQDVVREAALSAKQKIIVASCLDCGTNWDKNLSSCIEAAVDKKGVQVIFLVSDEFLAAAQEKKDKSLVDLVLQDKVQVRVTKERPKGDFLWVDDGSTLTYCSPYDLGFDDERTYVLTRDKHPDMTSLFARGEKLVQTLYKESELISAI